MKAVVKKKRPLLTKKHRRERLDFALSHKDWTIDDWKRVFWSDETKINRLGSDGRQWVWKKNGEGLSDRLVKGTKKFGGGSLMMWGCMTWEGAGYACEIDGKLGTLMCRSWMKNFKKASSFTTKPRMTLSFNKIMTPSTPAKRPNNGFKTMNIKLWTGLHNPQTSAPLNTFGSI